MALDFRSLKGSAAQTNQTDPEEIFKRLSRSKDSPNDLWRGQSDALRNWFKNKEKRDILISLNTGAGKTIVGILIAQSLVNEGIENVLYVCSTVDLVLQTSLECEKLGIKSTIYSDRRFSNDLFEQARAFCLTTYAAILQPFSIFRGQRSPGAIIFDDAHVSEKMIRDQFTLSIEKSKKPELYSRLSQLVEPYFVACHRGETLRDIRSGLSISTLMAPPNFMIDNATTINDVLRSGRITSETETNFPYQYIKELLNFSCFIINRHEIEITPPFIPSGLVSNVKQAARRIYLSATMNSMSDFIRAFGRRPDHVVDPKSDAGNGERLFVFGRAMTGPFDAKSFVARFGKVGKALVSVGDYKKSEEWASVIKPPERASFSKELTAFKKAQSGLFMLVFRVDGIDLPHETCRVMIIDGMSVSGGLLERLQWETFGMQAALNSRMAMRFTQLIGRINRGRNDYGVFFIADDRLNNWLKRKKTQALLSPLISGQLQIGEKAQEYLDIRSEEKLKDAIRAVLERDPGWVEYYTESINKFVDDEEERREEAFMEDRFAEGAVAEALFAEAISDGHYAVARSKLMDAAPAVARGDQRLAGWYNLWIGATYLAEGDTDLASHHFRFSKMQLGKMLLVPGIEGNKSGGFNFGSNCLNNAAEVLMLRSNEAFTKRIDELGALISALSADASENTPKAWEEVVRQAGALMGFETSRPDNEGSGGPDVVWEDTQVRRVISIELKTDKKEKGVYGMDDVGQFHIHLEWIEKNYSSSDIDRYFVLGPNISTSREAIPSPNMRISSLTRVRDILSDYKSFLQANRIKSHQDRHAELVKLQTHQRWSIEDIAQRLFIAFMKAP